MNTIMLIQYDHYTMLIQYEHYTMLIPNDHYTMLHFESRRWALWNLFFYTKIP
jgi:hypothetical protein